MLFNETAKRDCQLKGEIEVSESEYTNEEIVKVYVDPDEHIHQVLDICQEYLIAKSVYEWIKQDNNISTLFCSPENLALIFACSNSSTSAKRLREYFEASKAFWDEF